MPNWKIHDKWTKKAGIDPLIANFVNRNIDYGTEWAFSKKVLTHQEIDEPISLRQLKFFYQKDLEKKYDKELLYVKAYFIHHFLDFLKETRLNLHNLDQIFIEFSNQKVFMEIVDQQNKIISFEKQLQEIRKLVEDSRDELFKDLF